MINFNEEQYDKSKDPRAKMIYSYIINELLPSKFFITNSKICYEKFNIQKDIILLLCEMLLPIFKSEPTVIKLRSGVKVFGSLHGQYQDLIKFFK